MSEPVTISDEMIADLDCQRTSAYDQAARDRRWAEAKAIEAASSEEQAAQLDVVRRWVAAHLGMTLDEAITEAEAQLEKARADCEAAEVRAEELREEARDLLGYQRVLEREAADLKAQEA